MQHHPLMMIEVSGHTDNQGDRYLNIRLSKERAEVVKQYLTSKGIEEKRIKCVGYGPDRPISANHTEAMRKLNRRVEFKILKSD
jgi:outer membrane protein OmpA-like peptidoglycan-associated protein